MPRFVVLRHDPTPAGTKPLHWDLMLERTGVLLTWALATEPEWGTPIPAERLADHRMAYLDYEGALTQGRGTVSRWDRGTYEVHSESDEAFHAHLQSDRLNGDLILRRTSATDKSWTAEFVQSRELRVES